MCLRIKPGELLIERSGLDGYKCEYEYDACDHGSIARCGQVETRFERDTIGRMTAKR